MKFTKKIKILDISSILIGKKKFHLTRIRGERYKYFGRNFVIKMDNRQTVKEIDLLKKISKEDRKYFPEIFKHSSRTKCGFSYIVQERIKFRKGPMSLSNRKIVKKLVRKYKLQDIICDEEISNFSQCNCGTRLDGTPVIYDFGF